MKMKLITSVLATAVIACLLLTATTSQAGLVGVSNGDFEADGGKSSTITDWFEALENDNEWAEHSKEGKINGVGTGKIEGGNAGRIYQAIGTIDSSGGTIDGEPGVRISGLAGEDEFDKIFDSLAVELWSWNDATAADGVDIAGNGTFLDGVVLTESDLDPDGDDLATAENQPFSVTLSVSGGLGDDVVWLGLADGELTNGAAAIAGSDSPYFVDEGEYPSVGDAQLLDDISVEAVPEPGSALLLLLGGSLAALLRNRLRPQA